MNIIATCHSDRRRSASDGKVEEPAFLRHVTDAVKRPLTCHPEAAESRAKRATPNEGIPAILQTGGSGLDSGLAQARADRIKLKRLEFA
jgi:hypothetical protein